MKKAIILLISFVFLLLLLLIPAGHEETPVETLCPHSFKDFHSAVPASFFAEGNIAYFECSNCQKRFNEQNAAVNTVAIPKLSTDLSICVNGTPIPLVLSEQSSSHITWALENLKVEKGDIITLCDTSSKELIYEYFGEGNVDQEGKILSSFAKSTVSLIATPNGLALSIRDDKYPGVVVEINGEQIPLHHVPYYQPNVSTYVYGFVELKAGDQIVIVDNTKEVTYDYDDLAPEHAWNDSDYHRGKDGEFVIDQAARYRLEFSRGGNQKVSISKVFPPSEGDAYRLVFPNEASKNVTMKGTRVPTDSALRKDFIWYVTHETTMNGSDIAQYIKKQDLYAYSTVLFLEKGTKFYIENVTSSTRITGDHLVAVMGSSPYLQQKEDTIEITRNGTYRISYLPAYGGISIEQTSSGGSTNDEKSFDKKIAAIPSSLELYYMDEIKALYAEYLTLSDYSRSLLKASAKLETMYQNVLALEKSSSQVIYYMNTPSTKHVYPSKEALFNAFFTDFYYYIVAYHGNAHLKSNQIYNVNDFVNLAKNYHGAGASNLYGIGNVAGQYFLEQDKNGILENQTEKAFLGFCYQHGLYQELLPFFIRFFAYWRIDELYATPSNCGADLFAESWAATVDIAKFFYYNEKTSYVKTERMLDCLTNTASVVYNLDSSSLLPDIKLRGYRFEGWYDNPDFRGSPITSLTSTDGKIKLYAKWSIDKAQTDKDSAKLVDVYIYNLTTKKAVVNATTVGYVKEMYDNLSANAKQLVKEYPTLKGLINQYS